MANQFLGKQSFSAGLGTHTGHVNLQKSRKYKINKPSEVLLPVTAPLLVKHHARAGISVPAAADLQGKVLGPRQEMSNVRWVSVSCGTSSLKLSHPIHCQQECGSPSRLKTAGKATGYREAGLQQGLEGILVAMQVMGSRK